MKKQHTVLEVLFPQVRAEILRLLFTPPQKQRYVRELARMSGLTLSTVQEELRRLSALKLVKSWSNRFHRSTVPTATTRYLLILCIWSTPARKCLNWSIPQCIGSATRGLAVERRRARYRAIAR
jgi:predicted transcriptional regulator